MTVQNHATSAPPVAPVLPDRARASLRVWLLAAVIGVSAAATVLASHRTSPTFDEIVLIAGGARGYETGRFDLAPDHPPLMQYVYGLPVFLSRPNYPDESGYSAETIGSMGYRYLYAQLFFWRSDNDPERIAALGRLPAAAISAVLVLLVFGFVRRTWGTGAGLLAATLTAFLPDVLAHGGVAYNDVPLAVTFLGAIWASDAAIRRPTAARGALAGVALALAVATKVSGVLVFPVAFVLLVLEVTARGRDTAWFRALAAGAGAALFAAYLTMVLIYAGDWSLEGIRYAIGFQTRHAADGHGASAFLLGQRSTEGWWYYFPVAFLFKTSAALHLLLLLAVIQHGRSLGRSWRTWLRSELRAPLVGIAVFGVTLISSSLNIGFRYALPVLPLVVIVTASGVARLWAWDGATRWLRGIITAAAVWPVILSLSYYPDFLTFVSEYGPGRDRNHDVFVDSSLDWGQGLLQLRDFLREEGNPLIYLSYFGSALPDGYGIDYVAGPSFFPLPPGPNAGTDRIPRYFVVSATNLQGAYFPTDPFRRVREEARPERIIAGSLLVYRWQ